MYQSEIGGEDYRNIYVQFFFYKLPGKGGKPKHVNEHFCFLICDIFGLIF